MEESPRSRTVNRVLGGAVTVLVAAIVAVTGHHLASGHDDPDVAFDPAGLPPAAAPAAVPATVADIGFLQDMSDHHAQAVLMAGHAVRHAAAAPVRTMATNIVTDQAFERGTMAAYLDDRGSGAGDPERQAMAWMGHPVPLEAMPGLIAGDRLAAFLALEGEEADRRFLELMIEHHEGGVEMAQWAQQLVSDPAIRSLAGRMAVAQQEEISDMEALLGPPVP